MGKTVVGLFDRLGDAQTAMRDLQNVGFQRDSVTFVQQAQQGLLSRLTHAAIPQQDAEIYADGVQHGGGLILLQALTDADAERAADILDRYPLVNISTRRSNYKRMSLERSSSSVNTATANSNLYEGGAVAIPIIEEEISIGKRAVDSGGVRVDMRVEEVPVSEQVTLREEHVDVQRRRVDRPVSDADLAALQHGTFELRETNEEALVSKQARIVEEVVIHKDVTERTATIQDTVRHTEVDVEQVPAGAITASTNAVQRAVTSSANTVQPVATTSTTNRGKGTTGKKGKSARKSKKRH